MLSTISSELAPSKCRSLIFVSVMDRFILLAKALLLTDGSSAQINIRLIYLDEELQSETQIPLHPCTCNCIAQLVKFSHKGSAP